MYLNTKYFDIFTPYKDPYIQFNQFFHGRLIVELGYRSSGTLSREKFFQTKAELAAARNINNKPDVDGENGEKIDGRKLLR